MTGREKLVLNALIWACVYPAVLLTSYGFDWLGIDWPLWAEIGVSTAATVPLIGMVCAPAVEKMIAAAEGRSAAELKLAQAEEAEGPSPREIVTKEAAE